MSVRFDPVKSVPVRAVWLDTDRMFVRVLASVAAGLTLVSCGSAESHDRPGTGGTSTAAIELDKGSGYLFYPRAVPSGTMSAQAAFNAWLRDQHQPPKPLPAKVIPRYGLLTQDDTSPPAYRMPVWAFTIRGGCTGTTDAPVGPCVFWEFARASDGKNLGVGDPQPVS